MAEKPGQEKSLHELRQQAAHSRDRLGRDLSGLRYELDFPLKFRKSFQRQTCCGRRPPAWWRIFAVMPAGRKMFTSGNGKPDGKSMGDEQKKGLIGGIGHGFAATRGDLLKPALMKSRP